MSEKVKLPKEVAEAIETMRSGYGRKNREIIETAVRIESFPTIGEWIHPAKVIRDYAKNHFDNLVSSLVNGYEVEMTPEEKVREDHSECKTRLEKIGDHPDSSWWRGRMNGIETTLETLGIKISGVNAE